MSNNIGNKVADIKADQAWQPITQVKVKVDQSNTFTAGTTTGRTFEVECPIGSQAVADNLLAALNGYVYKAYEATDALIKPTIELGQSVSVGDVYSIVGGIYIKGDMILAANLSAPGSGDIDHEYPYDEWKRVIVDAKNIRHGGGHGTVSGLAVTPETINWVQLAQNAVTSTRLAIEAVQTWAIGAGAVTADKIDIPDLLSNISAFNIEAQLITANINIISPLANITYITCGAMNFDGDAVSWQSKTVVTDITVSRTTQQRWMYIDSGGQQQTNNTHMVTNVTKDTSTIYYMGKA